MKKLLFLLLPLMLLASCKDEPVKELTFEEKREKCEEYVEVGIGNIYNDYEERNFEEVEISLDSLFNIKDYFLSFKGDDLEKEKNRIKKEYTNTCCVLMYKLNTGNQNEFVCDYYIFNNKLQYLLWEQKHIKK